MKVWSDSIRDGGVISPRFALGRHHPEQHCELTENRSPHIAWSNLPKGTQSLVLICHDVDCPTRPDDVNKEGRTVPVSLPRADFYHWVLVDLPPDASPLHEAEFSSGVVAHGKTGPEAPRGTRQGLNDYTSWFAGDDAMKGRYFGYDGPCPPWNDERIHRYIFTLYAIDLPRCPVEGSFSGPEVIKAIAGHVLGQASFSGAYHIYPDAVRA